ncbi:hypothetical protein CANARDRAFT_29225 [[Candida] arabinofermentans NRRL YB-2248]|uniref:Asparagine--tRNA ligase, mitochondrial n=1 Tax=[Candida] arabinofermentans NRRL YB-2248 TaxID=983967 RepID=A0A1E4SXY6_9ASCO|nr:hypothetical protein CANARDRAFT_29225 [[Candida] arabinofermentans NRRL YB-2248]
MLSSRIAVKRNALSVHFTSQFSRLSSSKTSPLELPFPKSISEILSSPPANSSPITVNGWVSGSRTSKNVAFVDVRDGTTFQDIKCIVRPPSLIPSNLNTGSSVTLHGLWTEGKKGSSQAFELQVNGNDNPDAAVKVLGEVEELYPLQKKSHTAQFLRTIPEYRLRTIEMSAILRFRSVVETALVEFFNSAGFTKTHPPLITSSDCEGAGELFKVESNSKVEKGEKFFGKDAYLSVSTQLHLEVMCAALSRVWTLTPCFRAEESDTNRHLSEFWMLEAEVAFVEDVRQLTRFSEMMIKSVVQRLHDNLENSASNLTETIDKQLVETMTSRWEMMLKKDQWDTITYTEAIEILHRSMEEGKTNFKFAPIWGESLKSEHEKWLAGSYFGNPVFVTDYPLNEKPFYMQINPENSDNIDKATVACFDLLVPDIGELIGGSMREHDLKKLEAEISRREMDVSPLQWYLALRENGSVPHGGFGMGFERLLQYLSCTENIRDVVPFPRHVDSCPC